MHASRIVPEAWEEQLLPTWVSLSVAVSLSVSSESLLVCVVLSCGMGHFPTFLTFSDIAGAFYNPN